MARTEPNRIEPNSSRPTDLPHGQYRATHTDQIVISHTRELLTRSVELLRDTAGLADRGRAVWPRFGRPHS
jgi:hypothetical protein